nr:hypothetical protein [Tanacetum cinerariifolium]GEV30849.1 hypothetical protein [Tanacetum cinerariifolium]
MFKPVLLLKRESSTEPLGILRQLSVARTPQQNGVAKRRNRILIEAARTMLADFKSPTTLWAKTNTNFKFYEAIRCLVTILNTIDHLGKFNGKVDEGFFVGYSLNSKAFSVFNYRTMIVKENLHIRFSESTPSVVGSGPDWLFDIDALKRIINYETIVVDPRKENNCKDQEKEDNINNTNNINIVGNVNNVSLTVNVASTNEINNVGGKTSIELPFQPKMLALEDDSIFYFLSDDEDDGAVADMNNLDTTIQVSPISTTRIYNDHPLDQVIEDLQSATQTRKMLKNLEEHGFIEEEVYVCQPPGFEDPDFLDRVYKVKKALYGLHQAPRAWFTKIKTASTSMETQKPLIKDKDGEEVDVHMYRYLKGQPKLGLWYPKDSLFDLVVYTDSDYAGASLDRNSITGDEAVHKELGDSLVRDSTTASSLEAERDSVRTNHRGTTAQTRFESVSKHSNDSLLARGNTLQSDEDSLKLYELMELCTTLQNKVLDLEKTMTTQINDIASLKRRVMKLEKENTSRTNMVKRLYKVGLTARVESSSNEESLGEDASKQGRIDAIDVDEEITLVSVQDEVVSNDADKEMFDVDVLDDEDVFVEEHEVAVKRVNEKLIDAGDIVSITSAATTVSAATTNTATITTVGDITLAQALKEIKNHVIESVKPIKRKDQIRLDEEAALKLQATFDEEERLAREKAKKDEVSPKSKNDMPPREKLDEEKARRRGKVYNWETTTYGKIWDNEDVHDFRSIDTEFPAIVSMTHLKTDSKNDNDKVNMPLLPSPKPTIADAAYPIPMVMAYSLSRHYLVFISQHILMISSPNHPTFNIENAFSLNFPDYLSASPDYVSASPGKTYFSSSNSFGIVLIASPSLSLFHNDTYMKELLSPKKQGHDHSSSSTSTLPEAFKIEESSRNINLERHEEQIEEISIKSSMPLHFRNGITISSPNHPTFNIKNAFSSNFPDYLPASPDYVSASPRKTYSSSSNLFGIVLIALPSLSLFHNDTYMKVMHAYYAEKSAILPSIITPPSLMPNPQEFFFPEELLSPKKQGYDQSSFSTSTLPQAFEIGESSRKTNLERHEEQIKEILNHLDEISLDRIEHIEDKI